MSDKETVKIDPAQQERDGESPRRVVSEDWLAKVPGSVSIAAGILLACTEANGIDPPRVSLRPESSRRLNMF